MHSGVLRGMPLPAVWDLPDNHNVDVVVLKACGRVQCATDVQTLPEAANKSEAGEARERVCLLYADR